jgi:hypothetical protein
MICWCWGLQVKDKDDGWMLAASRRWYKRKMQTWYACRRDKKRKWNLALCNGDGVVRVAGWLDDSKTIVVRMQLTSREREMAGRQVWWLGVQRRHNFMRLEIATTGIL